MEPSVYVASSLSHLWVVSHQMQYFQCEHGEELNWICRVDVPGRCQIKAGSSYLVCRQHKRLQ